MAARLRPSRSFCVCSSSSICMAGAMRRPASTLLGDGVRVLTRTILRAKAVLPESTNISSTAFRNRTRSLRRVMHQLIDTARRRGEGAADALQASYRRLVGLTTQVVRQAQQVEMALATATDARGQRLRIVIQTFIPR